jgi:penicillin-binding protein 1C
LGGVGISLEDLTTLYVALADDGEASALRYLASAPAVPGKALMTRAAAWNVGDILRGSPPPDGVALERARPVAYKTGTSYGFRDAWSLGYSPAYTVAVWVGRVEGSPRPGAFGRNTAAPLLFELFDLLPPEPADAPPAPRGAGRHPSVRLAPALQRYMPWGATLLTGEAAGPRIVFPPVGAVLDSIGQNGGTPPYRWAVNGVPLAPPPVGSAPSWRPDGPGFARISVTDQNDQTATESIRLQ